MRAGAITVETVALATLLSVTLRRDVVTTTGPRRSGSAAEASIRSLPAAQHPSPRTSRRRRAHANDAELWARDSCETLLDTAPPPWWPPDLPDAAPPDAAPPPAPTEYLPFCSLVMLRSLAVDDPTARRAALVADTRRWIDDNNACRSASGDEATSSREGLAAPSGAATFVPPELRLMDGADNLSEGIPPAPPNDRRRRRRLHVRTYVDQILARKAEARMRCCHGIGARDRTCQAMLRAVML